MWPAANVTLSFCQLIGCQKPFFRNTPVIARWIFEKILKSLVTISARISLVSKAYVCHARILIMSQSMFAKLVTASSVIAYSFIHLAFGFTTQMFMRYFGFACWGLSQLIRLFLPPRNVCLTQTPICMPFLCPYNCTFYRYTFKAMTWHFVWLHIIRYAGFSDGAEYNVDLKSVEQPLVWAAVCIVNLSHFLASSGRWLNFS